MVSSPACVGGLDCSGIMVTITCSASWQPHCGCRPCCACAHSFMCCAMTAILRAMSTPIQLPAAPIALSVHIDSPNSQNKKQARQPGDRKNDVLAGYLDITALGVM